MRRRWFSAVRVCAVLLCCLQVLLPRIGADDEGPASPHRRSGAVDLADLTEETEEVKGVQARPDDKGNLGEPTDYFFAGPSTFLVLQQVRFRRVSFAARLLAAPVQPHSARGPPA